MSTPTIITPRFVNSGLFPVSGISKQQLKDSPDDVAPARKARLVGMEFRLEPRKKSGLVVSVRGRDRTGECFTEEVIASSISVSGALLSGMGREMRPGDLIWTEYAGKSARFKVVWVRNSGSEQLTQAAVHLCPGENSPWKDKIF